MNECNNPYDRFFEQMNRLTIELNDEFICVVCRKSFDTMLDCHGHIFRHHGDKL